MAHEPLRPPGRSGFIGLDSVDATYAALVIVMMLMTAAVYALVATTV